MCHCLFHILAWSEDLCGMQLRHIPMVHVMHCEGRGWDFSGNDEFYMHLRGNHAQIRPVGELSVKFHDGDEYVWSTVSLSPGRMTDPYRCVGDVC